MKHASCNLCGETVTDLHAVHRRNEMVLVKCPGCHLVFDIDAGTPAQEEARVGVQKGIDFYFERKNGLVFREELLRIMRICPPPARLMDFGCGVGMFLEVAREFGYDVHGIEVNEEAVDYIRNKALFPVFTSIEEAAAKLGNKTMDIVYSSHTLEHVSNPGGVLNGLSHLLKPSGWIVIIVPNYGRFSIWVDKRHSFLIAKGHQFYFTRETLKRCLGREFAEIQYRYSIMGGFAMRALDGKMPMIVKKAALSVLKGVFAGIYLLGANLNLTVYARNRK